MEFPMRTRFIGLALFSFIFLALPSLTHAYTSNDYYQAGLNFYQQKDYTKAIQYFKTAVQMDPNNWQAYQVLGSSYYQSGDTPNALSAFDQSLQIHPDNPGLKSYTDHLHAQNVAASTAPTLATAPPLGSAPVSSVGTQTLYVAGDFTKPKWITLHVGVAYATLGDLPGAATAFEKSYPSTASYTTSASVNNIGVLLGLEGGLALDPENAISASIDGALFGGYQDSGLSTTDLTQGGTDTLSPTMIAAQLNYYHYFLMGNSRLILGLGAGVYGTMLNVDSVANGQTLISGNLNGYGFGGTLNLGWETILGGSFTLNIFAQARFATTSNIQGNETDSAGNSQQVGLATNSTGFLYYLPLSEIGNNGTRWANIDYTGGDLGIALSLRY